MPITDLTGYKWTPNFQGVPWATYKQITPTTISNIVQRLKAYDNDTYRFKLNFTLYNGSTTYQCRDLWYSANQLLTLQTDESDYWSIGTSRSILITGGNDKSNLYLINYLQTNGTLEEGAVTCITTVSPNYSANIQTNIDLQDREIKFNVISVATGCTFKEWYYKKPDGTQSQTYTTLGTIPITQTGEYKAYFTYNTPTVTCSTYVTPTGSATVNATVQPSIGYISLSLNIITQGATLNKWYYVTPSGTRSIDYTTIGSGRDIPITESGNYKAYITMNVPHQATCTAYVTPVDSAEVEPRVDIQDQEIDFRITPIMTGATLREWYYKKPSGQVSETYTVVRPIYITEDGEYKAYFTFDVPHQARCEVYVSPTNVATIVADVDEEDEEISFRQTAKSNLFDFSNWYYVTPSGVESQRFSTLGRISITEDGEYKAYFNYVRNSNPDVPLPDIPTDTIIDTKPFGWLNHGETGMYRIFVPTTSQLSNIGNWLYSSTFKDALEAFLTKDLLNLNIADIVMNFCVYPFVVQPTGTAHLKYGWISASVGTTPIDVNYTTRNYYEFNCGTIKIPEYYQSAIDYETQAQIYLPFIGVKPLETYDAIGKDINPIYQFDLLTGECVCKIKINGSVKYQFTGNCGYNIPLSQTSNTGSIMKTLGGAISTALAISGAGAVSSVVTTATTSSAKYNYSKGDSKKITSSRGSEETTTTTTKPLVSGSSAVKEVIGNFSNMGGSAGKSGSLSSNTGYLGVTTPYLEIIRPDVSIPENFEKYNGYPCNKYLTLGDLTGYTIVDEIILTGFTCTEQELEEIETVLKGGVIL